MADQSYLVGECQAPDCGVPLVSEKAWRQGIRPEGHARHGGKKLCNMHYKRFARNGTFDRQKAHRPQRTNYREYRTLDEVLEDYQMIRDDCSSVREAADRMGMTFSALDRALYRARQQGLPGALPPMPQVERAMKYGAAHYLAA